MELLQSTVAASCAVVALLYFCKFLNWVWFVPKKLEKSLRQQGLVGNSYRFLVGDLKEMIKMRNESLSSPISFSDDYVPRTFPFMHKTITNHGKNSFVWYGPYPSVVISDPEDAREIFAKSSVFQKPNNPVGKVLAQGLASYETDKWAKHRRLINPAFELEKVKLMLPSFYLSCCDMLSKWDNIARVEGWFQLDVWPYLQTLTSDAISRTAFGSSYEEGRKIFQLQAELIPLAIKATISFLIPGLRFLPTRTQRRIKHIKREIESLVLGIITKRMGAIEAGEPSSNNLLDILLESNLREINQKGHKFGMSLQDVVEECKLFYIAGQETTSSLLVWTMILLSKHLDWQDRAREEVRQAFGSEEPGFEALNGLKIVTMILHEVLRLYPPAFIFGRTIYKETTLGNITLPAGIGLMMPTFLFQHDPEIWGEDAKEFNPERFRDGASKATGECSYFPFGRGPRICIAQSFAMTEAKMAIAMILRHYSFELSSSYSHAPTIVATLQPQHGAHLVLHKL